MIQSTECVKRPASGFSLIKNAGGEAAGRVYGSGEGGVPGTRRACGSGGAGCRAAAAPHDRPAEYSRRQHSAAGAHVPAQSARTARLHARCLCAPTPSKRLSVVILGGMPFPSVHVMRLLGHMQQAFYELKRLLHMGPYSSNWLAIPSLNLPHVFLPGNFLPRFRRSMKPGCGGRRLAR